MKQKYSNDLSHHILPNSSTMVGVCIMVITIVKTLSPDFVHYLIDEALAIVSVVFMVSALLSFLSIRANNNSQKLETYAEILFLIGLGSMTIITVVLSFDLF